MSGNVECLKTSEFSSFFPLFVVIVFLVFREDQRGIGCRSISLCSEWRCQESGGYMTEALIWDVSIAGIHFVVRRLHLCSMQSAALQLFLLLNAERSYPEAVTSM